jgi:hypothetical protein
MASLLAVIKSDAAVLHFAEKAFDAAHKIMEQI